MKTGFRVLMSGVICCLTAPSLPAHEIGPRTHIFSLPAEVEPDRCHLLLTVLDGETRRPTPARFTLQVDGVDYVPDQVGPHGVRLLSVHIRKKQNFVATYTRGKGSVFVPLPCGASEVTVQVARGFQYVPVRQTASIENGRAELTVCLRRWVNLEEEGWQATDEHVHFDRLDSSHDEDWLTLMEGDGLQALHVLTLEGANLPDVWARQFAYGEAGEASDGVRFIRPGEEFRNADQGHYNLLGISQLIRPVSTGRLLGGEDLHWPASSFVLNTSRQLGGIGGVAHGGAFGARHTAVLDTVLGNLDFFEILNPGRYKTDLWYRVLNAGYLLAPAGGTDLPNSPARAWWQPFLGSVRCFVKVGENRSFQSWKSGLQDGRVFVTNGPLLRLSAEGHGVGETLRLDSTGARVEVEAELSTLHRPRQLNLLFNGRIVGSSRRVSMSGPVHRIRIRARLPVNESGWLAARGAAVPLEPAVGSADGRGRIVEGRDAESELVAHTGVIRVLVGEEPIGSPAALTALQDDLVELKTYYDVQGKYGSQDERRQTLSLFEEALDRLTRRLANMGGQ